MNDKSLVISGISTLVQEIADVIDSCPEKLLNQPVPDKWSIAEQVIHLNKSVAPLNLSMGLPKLTFYIFGRVSFSRTYEEIRTNYQSCLSDGAKASAAYIPVAGKVYERHQLKRDFTKAYAKYLDHISVWEETDLDRYRLPHPIIGKLTMREMAYFTQYHLEHHLVSIGGLVSNE